MKSEGLIICSSSGIDRNKKYREGGCPITGNFDRLQVHLWRLIGQTLDPAATPATSDQVKTPAHSVRILFGIAGHQDRMHKDAVRRGEVCYVRSALHPQVRYSTKEPDIAFAVSAMQPSSTVMC